MFLIFVFRFKLFDFQYNYVIIIFVSLRNDSGLLINGLLKMEFRENFGAIFDFPTFRTKVNLKVTTSR